MEHILDYAQNRIVVPFKNDIISPVESLILSQISYFPLFEADTPIYFSQLTDYLNRANMANFVVNLDKNMDLIKALSDSTSWSKVLLLDSVRNLDMEVEKQFAANLYRIKEDIYYIAFSGTDLSFTGWKEDFNLSFMDEIPSQVSALAYTRKAMQKYPGKFYIGGHSKGGNLAYYTMFNLEDELIERLIRVDNFDGPGFNIDEEDKSKYEKRLSCGKKYLPENSVVGRMFDYKIEDTIIIKTSSTIIFDHDPHYWKLQGGDFILADKTSKMSTYVFNTLKTFNSNLTDDLRREVVEDLYNIVISMEAENFGQVLKNWRHNLRYLFNSLRNLKPDDKEKFNIVRKAFRKSLFKN